MQLLCNSIIVKIYSAFFYAIGVGLAAAALLSVVRLSRQHTAMDRASSTGNTWYTFVLQIRCTMVWAAGVVLVQIFCGVWFATSRLDASSYVTHAYMTGFSDVAMSALALLAVYTPTPRTGLRGGAACGNDHGTAMGSRVVGLLPRGWLENLGCCCCSKGRRTRQEHALRGARAQSRAVPNLSMPGHSSTVRNPVTAGVDAAAAGAAGSVGCVEMVPSEDGSRSSQLVLRESGWEGVNPGFHEGASEKHMGSMSPTCSDSPAKSLGENLAFANKTSKGAASVGSGRKQSTPSETTPPMGWRSLQVHSTASDAADEALGQAIAQVEGLRGPAWNNELGEIDDLAQSGMA